MANVPVGIAAVLSLSAAMQMAGAQPHGGDVILTRSDGVLVTGTVDPLTGDPSSFRPERVFIGDFQASGFTNNPGFDALPASLPPAARVGFDITRALRRWNGSDFSEQAGQVRLNLTSALVAFTPLDDTPTPGFGVLTGAPTGSYHHHFGMTLLPPAANGVYLLERVMWCRNADGSPSGIADSAPFWFVLNRNRSQAEAAAAAAWVAAHLAASPAPCSAADVATAGQHDLSAGPDGVLTGDDFDAFILAFFTEYARPGRGPLADITDGDGTGGPDGFVTGADFDRFVQLFFEGCP